MAQIQRALLVGASYAERFAADHKIKLPKEIKNPADAKFLSISHDSHGGDKATVSASEIIIKFNEVTEEIIKKYNKNPDFLKNINLSELITNFVNGHNRTEQLIKVYESVLSDNNVNSFAYIYAKEHFMIAKIFLNKLREINVESIKNKKLELNEEAKEDFKLGVFIGLEPIFVTAIFSSLGRDNPILIQNYGKLVEYYAHIVAKNYSQEYLNATGINKPILKITDYSKLLSFIEAERNG